MMYQIIAPYFTLRLEEKESPNCSQGKKDIQCKYSKYWLNNKAFFLSKGGMAYAN